MAKPPCRDGRRNNRPPISGQFKPGKSPNPLGRRHGARNHKAIILEAFNAKVSINRSGKTIRISKYESGMIQLANKFALGDPKVFAHVNELLHRHGLMGEETAAFLATLSERDEPVLGDIIRRIREASPTSSSEPDKTIGATTSSEKTDDAP
jgi:hypothetical protein